MLRLIRLSCGKTHALYKRMSGIQRCSDGMLMVDTDSNSEGSQLRRLSVQLCINIRVRPEGHSVDRIYFRQSCSHGSR